ncbi:phosphotransferase family protein [Chondromyces crocatus]|uniref:Aminoglycoside resistance protein n=1 Tax=Chondromyces crocatus TaxID=52 RepID=A0A0K1E8D8_CHOCO|nr:aminoglycoside phosphotransferase family protein [Chondromyces crocatus]AKT36957.1 aminoglycoside resistance protein [Chondromyces crocatus]
MSEPTLDELRQVIVDAFPELASSRFTLLTMGWQSLAVDVDDRLIFKFPRDEEAEKALISEAGVLAVVRPALTMTVPDLTLHQGTRLFSRHDKLRGEHLLAPEYERLGERSRQVLAEELALFYAEMHALPEAALKAAGAGPAEAWMEPDEILEKAWPRLPPALRPYAEQTLAVWRDLPPDPHGTTFGFFDGHGWNMAFDHERERLQGIYDFADAGFGVLHREFLQSDWIARDLTARIIPAYERLTGRAIDRARVALMSGVLRLWELADLAAEDTPRIEAAVRIVEVWAASERA